MRRMERLARLCMAGIVALMFCAVPAARAQDEDSFTDRADMLNIPYAVQSGKLGQARQTGFALTIGAGALIGYDDNIFRGPAGGETGGTMWGAGAILKTDKRFNAANRLEADLALQQTAYPGNAQVNVRKFDLDLAFEHAFNDAWSLTAGADARWKSDDGASITGFAYTRDYAYLRTTYSLFADWDITRDNRLSFGVETTLKDYDETAGLTSLDSDKLALLLRYRYRIDKGRTLRVWIESSEQTYDEEPANLADGTEIAGNPMENHRRLETLIWYTQPLGDRAKWDVKGRWRSKDDLYRDYESYTCLGLDTGIAFKTTKDLSLTADIRYETKDFAAILGDGTDTLLLTETALDLGLNYRVGAKAWFFVSAALYDRNSNLTTGTLYRENAGNLISLGISTAF